MPKIYICLEIVCSNTLGLVLFLDKSLCLVVVECSLNILLVKPHHFFRARIFSPPLLEFIWCFALVRSFRIILCVLVYCSYYDGEKQKGRGPTFGDFVTILTEGIDAGQHSCKTTEYKSTDFPSPSLLNVMYCVRVSLGTVKIFLALH